MAIIMIVVAGSAANFGGLAFTRETMAWLVILRHFMQ